MILMKIQIMTRLQAQITQKMITRNNNSKMDKYIFRSANTWHSLKLSSLPFVRWFDAPFPSLAAAMQQHCTLNWTSNTGGKIQRCLVVHCGLLSSICIRNAAAVLVSFALIKPEVRRNSDTQAGSVLTLPSFQATEASSTSPFFSPNLK